MRVTFPPKLEFLSEPHRYKVLYGGRGGIKSWSVAQHLLIAGVERPLRIPCARETMQSIRESVHQLLEDQIARLGYQRLRHYRYEVEEAKSDPAGGHIALSKVPRHDWASHGADAFRTAAVMIREPEKKKEPEKRRPGYRLSPWS